MATLSLMFLIWVFKSTCLPICFSFFSLLANSDFLTVNFSSSRSLSSLFFDMQKPVLESLVLPLQGYGLKDICKHKDLVNFQWEDDDSGSQWSVVQFNRFLYETNPTQKQSLKTDILGYNRDDVIATRRLEEWLRSFSWSFRLTFASASSLLGWSASSPIRCFIPTLAFCFWRSVKIWSYWTIFTLTFLSACDFIEESHYSTPEFIPALLR